MEYNLIPIVKKKGKSYAEDSTDALTHYEDLKEAFKVLEEEPDKVNPHDVVKMFRDLGYEGSSPHLISMFEYLTSVADEKGFINYDQFIEGCSKFLGKNTPDEYHRKVYEMYTGKLSNAKNVSNKKTSVKKLL